MMSFYLWFIIALILFGFAYTGGPKKINKGVSLFYWFNQERLTPFSQKMKKNQEVSQVNFETEFVFRGLELVKKPIFKKLEG